LKCFAVFWQRKMNSKARIGQIPPFWPIVFCLFCSCRFARSAFPPTTREKGKKEKRGGGKKGTPPGTSYFSLSDFEKPSATPKAQSSQMHEARKRLNV
jgi:hypothetical protein